MQGMSHSLFPLERISLYTGIQRHFSEVSMNWKDVFSELLVALTIWRRSSLRSDKLTKTDKWKYCKNERPGWYCQNTRSNIHHWQNASKVWVGISTTGRTNKESRGPGLLKMERSRLCFCHILLVICIHTQVQELQLYKHEVQYISSFAVVTWVSYKQRWRKALRTL